MKLAMSSGHIIPTPGQSVLPQTLEGQASGRAASTEPIFEWLIQKDGIAPHFSCSQGGHSITGLQGYRDGKPASVGTVIQGCDQVRHQDIVEK